MNAFHRCVIAGCFVLLPALAQAQDQVQARQLKLVFSGGTVSIDADAVPLRAILDAWTTLGGTRIDGIDRLPDVNVTLHVEAVPEDEALASLLNGRSAFATVPRKSGEAGASRVARIAVFSSASATTAAGAPRSAVPADWPLPVNEHPDDEVRQPPTAEIKVERPGVEIPWPLPIDETIAVDTPATGVLEVPGVDVPWPLPVNHEPTLELEAPAPAVAVPVFGVDAPWPLPVNPNPVDPDAPAPVAEPAAAAAPVTSNPTAAETPSTGARKPATKRKGAPVSTRAPKPIPPRKPQP